MTYLELLNKLKNEVEDIPNEAEKLSIALNFSKNDVRFYFYGLFQTITEEYYLGKNTYIFFATINVNEIFDLIKDENYKNNHLERLFFKQKLPSNLDSLKNQKIFKKRNFQNLERNIILGCFSSFETCINLIFEKITIESTKTKIIFDMNSYPKKIKNLNLNEETIKIIEEHIQKSTFIPLSRKFRVLSNDNYNKENRKKDLEFLNFISKYRNCLLHNNGIYNDDKYEKKYSGSNFIFEKGKELIIQEESLLINWEICFEIKSIFTRLITSLNHKEFIGYPE